MPNLKMIELVRLNMIKVVTNKAKEARKKKWSVSVEHRIEHTLKDN